MFYPCTNDLQFQISHNEHILINICIILSLDIHVILGNKVHNAYTNAKNRDGQPQR